MGSTNGPPTAGGADDPGDSQGVAQFECVIGLEVHVQLKTHTKLFCGCPNRYGDPPNQNVCPVCSGHPGTLPVLSAAALELGVLGGLALGCDISPTTTFDRKHYFYPDLPKGYQISQLARPLNTGGALCITTDDGGARVVAIDRAHLEEDAGKSTHPLDHDHSLVDLNRAGVPLLEIVSAPDLRSPREAHRYLAELRRRLRYARVSDCDMEKGSLRCDANISIRPVGADFLMDRVEIKNLNSFRNVERALQHELGRQTALVLAGGVVVQETRLFREDDGVTATMRSKEDAEDYRYLPDPDLPVFVISNDEIEQLRARLPEMPDRKRARYADEFGLKEDAIEVLVAEADQATWFEECVAAGADPTTAANFFQASVLKAANERSVAVNDIPLTPADLAEVIAMVDAGKLSNQAARKVVQRIIDEGGDPASAVADLGLEQISDPASIAAAVEAAITENPLAVAEFQAGREAAINALVGAVMKATQGKANPNVALELLRARLQG